MGSGLLCSQVGHDIDEAVRVVYRGVTADALPAGAVLVARGPSGAVRQVAMSPWGSCWGAYWWTAELGTLLAGEWAVELSAGPVHEQAVLEVAAHRLWRASWRMVALEQLERRTRIARAGHGTGWQDCGCDWQEANSHAVCTLGLSDLLLTAGHAMDADERRRTQAQIAVGCRLLDLLQDEAGRRGLPAGSLVHEMLRAPQPLARDALWAALAWAMAAHAIGGDAGAAWRARARAALQWWEQAPIEHARMDAVAHGWTSGYVPPAERPVGDLALAAWAWSTLAEQVDDAACMTAAAYADKVMALQIAPAGSRPHGHFWEFSDRRHPAALCTHNNIGPDTGDCGMPPALALAMLLKRWPRHADAGRWRDACQAHAIGWLEPSAHAAPFAIAPRVWHDGWVHFGGLWHGMNAAYGLGAVLCDELAVLLDRPVLRAQATAQRQWIVGLNAGLTTAARDLGCHMTLPLTQEGRALPVSMITGVGHRWAGGWMAIPGSIANGFSAGGQFVFDVPGEPAADGPSSYTDEEWIVHAGAWLMAVARCAG
jgi:hypothetical protein